jgi:cyclophilin family peptidyl-prolyl cis-trans isomerase
LAKKNRREQQHMRQKPSRERQYRTGGTSPQEVYKPGFPMNLFTNAKTFWIVGLVAMVGGLIAASVLAGTAENTNPAVDLPDEPTPTATVEGSPTPGASPTPDSRRFEAAEDVINPEQFNYRAVITTDKGTLELDLFADEAPNTVNSFVFLARNGYFNNLRWHRVVPDFVVQSGDPFSEVGRELTELERIGTGGPGYQTEDEPNEISNTRGTISMAKTQGASSFGSQFFINLKDNPALDAGNGADEFYPFGEVTEGLDVLDEIEQDDVIQSIEIFEDPK